MRDSSAFTRRVVVVAAMAIGATIWAPLTHAASDEPDGLRALADAAAFDLGAAVDAAALDDPDYERLLIENVNMVSTRDELSFGVVQPTQGTFDFTSADAIVDFAVANEMTVRGHDLITPDLLPPWITEGAWTPESLREVLVEHVTTVVSHYAQRNPGVVTQWDVVARGILGDGTRRPSIWQTVIGDDYVNAAFTAARAADEDATLFYDDFYDDFSVVQDQSVGAESVVGGANATRSTCDAVMKCVGTEAMIASLLAADVPVDGVGFEAHLFSPDPVDFSQFSTWVVDLGLEWAFTEFDVPVPATEVDDPTILEFQASVYGAALTSCVESPSCNTFVTWGITDRFSSTTGGAFGGALWFDDQDVPKPALDAVVDVLSGAAPEAVATTTAVPTASPSTTPSAADDGGSGDSGGGAIVAVVVGVAALCVIVGVIRLRRRR